MFHPAPTCNVADLLATFRALTLCEQARFLALLLQAGLLPGWRIVRRGRR